MEMDFATSGVLEEDDYDDDVVEDYDIQDGSTLADEICGLCMDVVIDRGVLDCCEHWFCFACIDNWATITNLCPLCQNEFHSVACVPVYDTIGTNKVEGGTFTGEEGWYTEGQNNNLSFPSYYIDENAVICLDGDKCKIRNRPGIIDEDSNLDTSIACDSCDQWYHAICVGFDPESTSEDTWLCPRCAKYDAQISDVPMQMASDQCNSSSANNECLVDAPLSGKVAVSVADAGETAVVVSTIGVAKCNKEPSEIRLPPSDDVKDLKIQAALPESDANSLRAERASKERTETQTILRAQDLELSLSHSRSSESPLKFSTESKLEMDSAPGQNVESSNHESPICSKTLCNETSMNIKSSENDFKMGRHLGLSVNSFLSVEVMTIDKGESQSIVDKEQGSCSDDTFSTAEKMALSACKNATEITGVKRRLTDDRSNYEEPRAMTGTKILQKKIKTKETRVTPNENEMNKSVSDGSPAKAKFEDNKLKKSLEKSSDVDIMSRTKETRITPNENEMNKSISDGSLAKAKFEDHKLKKPLEKLNDVDILSRTKETRVIPNENEMNKSVSDSSPAKAKFEDNKLKKPLEKSNDVDIMSIIKETNHKQLKRVTNSGLADDQEKEKIVGLRVKKIIRRAGVDEDSSTEVEKLRKEIRDAVRNRSTKDIGEHLFDPKLLVAFRTAVVGPTNESVEKLSPLAIKTKKLMLQQGKARENLTKKIYGTSNGKRKRAWDRDCEVEFWKHRCMRATKPEKIKTLKSVLDLLTKNSAISETEYDSGEPEKNPILSRLYLADTSVFPRTEDIKPLSAFDPASTSRSHREHNPVEKGLKGCNDNSTLMAAERKVGMLGFHVEDVKNTSIPNRKTACTKIQTSRCPEKQESSHTSTEVIKKETDGISDDLRSDKRKWALEILARKNAATSKSSGHENQGDNTMIKKNYPLLAQLPKDMLPVLAPSHYNKIPVSVRQVQLYRIAEHFLKKTNLPVLRRTAATELAVADAVNIEKAAADRSNSKSVYVNLCSQELLHHTDDTKTDKTTHSSLTAADPIDSPEHSDGDLSTDPEAEEALRAAGLLSDSPPSSPHHNINVSSNLQDYGLSVVDYGGTREDKPVNISEMETRPELDIGCNLGDEGYCAARTANLSYLHGEDCGSNMEIQDPKSTHLDDSKDSSMPNCHIDAEIGSSSLHSTVQNSIPSESSFGEGNDKLSVAERVELYGPDKEQHTNECLNKTPRSYGLATVGSSCKRKDSGSNGNLVVEHSIEVSEFKSQNLAENEVANSSMVDVHPDNSGKSDRVLTTVVLHNADASMQSGTNNGVHKKVEAYIKEHIRPLCKSGVITAEQYRWAVTKTTNKVMQYHSKASNANFLIKEGDKVKKLAEQYVEAAQKKSSQ